MAAPSKPGAGKRTRPPQRPPESSRPGSRQGPRQRKPERRSGADPAELHRVFTALKTLLVKHARHLVIVHDAPDHYYLDTRKMARSGKPMFFGAVQMRHEFVLYNLMPLAVDPALATAISPALKKHMQGKNSFSFTTLDPVALEELDRLTRAGMASF